MKPGFFCSFCIMGSTALILTLAAPAFAQPPAPVLPPAPAHPLQIGPATLTLDGWTRVETRYRADFRPEQGNDPQNDLSRFRVGVRYALPDRPKEAPVVFFVQPQFSYRQSFHNASAANNDVTDGGALYQAWGEVTAAPHLVARLGRQELNFGEQRLIGAGLWGFMGRTFDGATLTYKRNDWNATALYTRLGHVANKANAPTLAGIYATRTASKTNLTDLYLLYKGDRVSGNGIAVWTLGLRPVQQITRQWTLSGEFAGQTGRVNGKTLQAYAGMAQAAYQMSGSIAPRLTLGYDFASGGDPSDPRRTHTFDQLYPTNHYLYGIGDFIGWRNMQDLRASVRGKVGGGAFSVEAHRFHLANARDFWYADGGAAFRGMEGKPLRSANGTAGRDIGVEYDLMFSHPLQKNTTLLVGVARFLPGSYVRQVNGCDCPSNWYFAQTGYRW